MELSNFLYIPHLSGNLVSVIALSLESIGIAFCNNSYSIGQKNWSHLEVGTQGNSLHAICFAGSKDSALVADGSAATILSIELWHQCLRHLGYGSLKTTE